MGAAGHKPPQPQSEPTGKRYLLTIGRWLLAKWWALLVLLTLGLVTNVLLLPLGRGFTHYWDSVQAQVAALKELPSTQPYLAVLLAAVLPLLTLVGWWANRTLKQQAQSFLLKQATQAAKRSVLGGGSPTIPEGNVAIPGKIKGENVAIGHRSTITTTVNKGPVNQFIFHLPFSTFATRFSERTQTNGAGLVRLWRKGKESVPEVHITSPKAGEIVPYKLSCTGTCSQQFMQVDLWVVIVPQQSAAYHPASGPVIKASTKNLWGRWHSITHVGRSQKHDIGQPFELMVIETTPEASEALRQYHLQQPQMKQRAHGGLSNLPIGCAMCDRIMVTRQ